MTKIHQAGGGMSGTSMPDMGDQQTGSGRTTEPTVEDVD